MTFRNCSVRGNLAGAIGTNNSIVTMIGCEILDNTGGPVASAGGGIYISGTFSLIDCAVSGNAASFSGGGIYVPGNAVLNLTRTRVCGNTAPNGAQIGQTASAAVHDLGGACVTTSCADCPPPQPCLADLNSDQTVDAIDLSALLAIWGLPGVADFNGDGVVGGADLGLLLDSWGVCD